MDRCPMPAEPQLLTLFEVFAARAAVEYRRLRVELMCALKRASVASDSFTSTLHRLAGFQFSFQLSLETKDDFNQPVPSVSIPSET